MAGDARSLWERSRNHELAAVTRACRTPSLGSARRALTGAVTCRSDAWRVLGVGVGWCRRLGPGLGAAV